MDVAKIGTVLDNLKMDPQDLVDEYAAKMNSNFSQLRELIPKGQIVNNMENPANRTNVVCEGINDNAIKHTHLQYLKYFFIAGLPKAILQLVASKDLATFSEARKEAVKMQELTKSKNDHCSTSAVEQKDESVNQIKGNGTQNPYSGNYRGRGGQGQGAPRGAPTRLGGYNGNNGGQPKSGDNQMKNGTKLTCWY